jgi:hypothetical protein
MVLWLTIIGLMVMPMEHDILKSQRFSPTGLYNTPLELKGKTFFVSAEERSQHQLYLKIAFCSLGVGFFGLIGNALLRNRKKP